MFLRQCNQLTLDAFSDANPEVPPAGHKSSRESSAGRQEVRLPTSSSVCDVLDATWSDAAVSQGLRRTASPLRGTPLRQRTSIPQATVAASDNDAGEQRKRQKTRVPAEDIDAEAHLSPTPPAQATPDVLAKPVAAKVMGNGKCGIWTATMFSRSKALIQLTNKLATGYHASLPCSSRTPSATYSKTLILPVDSSNPGAGETVSGTGLSEATAGGRNIVAGWAFAHKPGPDGVVSGQLEPVGLDGEPYLASRNRADLRAALAALEYCDWAKEDGVDRLVISTASYYMAKGLTSWLREWKIRQWHTVSNHPVPNRDLWERISAVMGEYAAAGCETSVFYTARNRFGSKLEAAAQRATRQPSPFNTGPYPT
ncbi:hypothetical protein Sste5346_007669 [Sporothrix stenoceras]|uniref:RNase H type-1 domain-containing protein n=1 Tax=Sporothrix stenoceras TaxID=5173 RepID=A0ABR3YSY1_9PEZI